MLGCTDRGKCAVIVENCSGALQPNICSGAFLKELDYLEFLLQQKALYGFSEYLKQLADSLYSNTIKHQRIMQHKALKLRFPKIKFCTLI